MDSGSGTIQNDLQSFRKLPSKVLAVSDSATLLANLPHISLWDRDSFQQQADKMISYSCPLLPPHPQLARARYEELNKQTSKQTK